MGKIFSLQQGVGTGAGFFHNALDNAFPHLASAEHEILVYVGGKGIQARNTKGKNKDGGKQFFKGGMGFQIF